jgi:general secretion pathway protein N
VRRILTLAIAALFVFLVLLLARFPARWAGGWLPQDVQCARLTGTIWNGRCAALKVSGAAVGDARWSVRAARLLAGKLAATVILTRPRLDVRGVFEISTSGTITGHAIKAVVPLDASVLPQLPPNLRGTIHADLERLVVSGKTVHAIEGRLEGLDLAQVGTSRTLALGDYVLTFPTATAGSEPIGTLEDLRGPLDVIGSLRLTHEPGWILEGRVAAQSDAPPDLARQLQYLGAPDASGRRAFSIAGTY